MLLCDGSAGFSEAWDVEARESPSRLFEPEAPELRQDTWLVEGMVDVVDCRLAEPVCGEWPIVKASPPEEYPANCGGFKYACEDSCAAVMFTGTMLAATNKAEPTAGVV